MAPLPRSYSATNLMSANPMSISPTIPIRSSIFRRPSFPSSMPRSIQAVSRGRISLTAFRPPPYPLPSHTVHNPAELKVHRRPARHGPLCVLPSPPSHRDPSSERLLPTDPGLVRAGQRRCEGDQDDVVMGWPQDGHPLLLDQSRRRR